MKILTFTTLFPNSQQIRHGVFIEQRIKHVQELHNLDIVVVAPVPWFPFKFKKFGSYAVYAKVPKMETRNGITIFHPRYPVIPKIGMNFAPLLMFFFLFPFVRKLHRNYSFDLIDAHFMYPDNIAALKISQLLGLPCTISARGSDINVYTKWAIPRFFIKWAVKNASACISVCKDLSNKVLELGCDPNRSFVVRNGVDLQLFREQNRRETRKKLELSNFTLLSVGNLIELKGHHLVIEALANISDVDLIIIGSGPDETYLKNLVTDLKLENRVKFIEPVTHSKLVDYYSACDCLVLASSSEGWANVLLESMACGTPTVATAVGGTPEIVTESPGLLISKRTADCILKTVIKLQNNYPKRADVRNYAEHFSWTESADNLYNIFSKAIR